MIVEVPVRIQTPMYDEESDSDVVGECVYRMWIDAADLVKVKNAAEITTKMKPKDYKFDLTGMNVNTHMYSRLYGCWSPETGHLIADKMLPVRGKDLT